MNNKLAKKYLSEAKKQIMRENGIHVVDSPAEIGKKVKEVLG